jgi:type IV pilus biogenesis protein CpaD/CtpE
MTGITTRFASLALAAGIAAVLAGCAESTQSKTCAQADKVRSSIENVRNVNLSENGMVALKSAVAQVGTELDLLRTTLAADAQAQVATVQTAVGQLRSTVATAAADPTPANLNEVGVARNAARSSIHDLATAVTSDC